MTTRPTGDKVAILREIVDTHSARRLGWVDPTTNKRRNSLVDVLSARVMLNVCELLAKREDNNEGLAKYTALPWPVMADRAWRVHK